MSGLQLRASVLIALLGGSLWLLTASRPSQGVEAGPRWPPDDATFVVDGWRAGAASLEAANGNAYVSRTYTAADDGLSATLVITTGAAAKRVYRAGAEVPLLGNGYSVAPGPGGLVDGMPRAGTLEARRGVERWLQIHVYGEQRGMLGNGPLAWSLAVTDTVLGRANDYYLLRLLVPMSADGQPDVRQVTNATTLARVLFPRIAAWYAR